MSVRLAEDRVLATPAGVAKVDLRPDDCVELTLAGDVIGGGRASTEIRMHLRIYERRPDLRAVVHAHPPTATGFAVAGQGLVAPVHPEIIFQLGWVPLVPYGTPGTPELPDAMEPFLAGHAAWLLANHGATTAGATLGQAHQRMEALEAAARIELTARQLGCLNTLSASQVERLLATRAAMGIRDPHPGPPPGARSPAEE